VNDTVQSILTPFRVEVKQNVIRWHFDSAVLTISRTITLVVCYCNPNGKLSTHYMCFVNTGEGLVLVLLIFPRDHKFLFLPDILTSIHTIYADWYYSVYPFYALKTLHLVSFPSSLPSSLQLM